MLLDLGFEISIEKLVSQAPAVTCIGINVNSLTHTLSIDQEKIDQIQQSCHVWSSKKCAKKFQLQSLLGQLLYIARCVKPARIFLGRMLNLLRQNHSSEKIKLNGDFFRDLAWFRTYMNDFNGVILLYSPLPAWHVFTDASLKGAGALFNRFIYAERFPPYLIGEVGIVELEMLNVIVAVRVWAQDWSNKNLMVHSDNFAVVDIINNNKTRNDFLAACMRNLWLTLARFNISIQAVHIPGKLNRVADTLSRWYESPPSEYIKNVFNSKYIWTQVPIEHFYLDWYI